MSYEAFPHGKPPEERRNTQYDRRGVDRQGKYDRRRNRCMDCKHFMFSPDGMDFKGRCLRHTIDIYPNAFACIVFEANTAY